MAELKFSPKYKAFLKCGAKVEFLEGTTAAGKTTVGIFKFIVMCAKSKEKLHILAADDVGTAEKNLIQKDLGILDDFGALVEYKGNGSGEYKMPHIILHTSSGDKIIFVVGYGNAVKWKDALGGQYGCLYIDEINTANISFVREASMRSDYIIGTLNPDDPALPVYKEYINKARPLDAWKGDTPAEILSELTEPAHEGWVHWFFTFDDNAGLPPEKKERILQNIAPDTKEYKNKVQGLRGKATGLVFSNFDKQHIIKESDITKQLQTRQIKFVRFTAGLDTAYSAKSPDTIAMMFYGITANRKIILLAERVYNNAELKTPLAPSDTAIKYIEFLEENRNKWGFGRDVFVDSADQATITELNKYKRLHGCLYNFVNAYKKISILDRINLQIGWLAQACYLVCDTCTNHINELNLYSWAETGDKPEDGHDHTINAGQYAWIPYRALIGYEDLTNGALAENEREN